MLAILEGHGIQALPLRAYEAIAQHANLGKVARRAVVHGPGKQMVFQVVEFAADDLHRAGTGNLGAVVQREYPLPVIQAVVILGIAIARGRGDLAIAIGQLVVVGKRAVPGKVARIINVHQTTRVGIVDGDSVSTRNPMHVQVHRPYVFAVIVLRKHQRAIGAQLRDFRAGKLEDFPVGPQTIALRRAGNVRPRIKAIAIQREQIRIKLRRRIEARHLRVRATRVPACRRVGLVVHGTGNRIPMEHDGRIGGRPRGNKRNHAIAIGVGQVGHGNARQVPTVHLMLRAIYGSLGGYDDLAVLVLPTRKDHALLALRSTAAGSIARKLGGLRASVHGNVREIRLAIYGSLLLRVGRARRGSGIHEEVRAIFVTRIVRQVVHHVSRRPYGSEEHGARNDEVVDAIRGERTRLIVQAHLQSLVGDHAIFPMIQAIAVDGVGLYLSPVKRIAMEDVALAGYGTQAGITAFVHDGHVAADPVQVHIHGMGRTIFLHGGPQIAECATVIDEAEVIVPAGTVDIALGVARMVPESIGKGMPVTKVIARVNVFVPRHGIELVVAQTGKFDHVAQIARCGIAHEAGIVLVSVTIAMEAHVVGDGAPMRVEHYVVIAHNKGALEIVIGVITLLVGRGIPAYQEVALAIEARGLVVARTRNRSALFVVLGLGRDGGVSTAIRRNDAATVHVVAHGMAHVLPYNIEDVRLALAHQVGDLHAIGKGHAIHHLHHAGFRLRGVVVPTSERIAIARITTVGRLQRRSHAHFNLLVG